MPSNDQFFAEAVSGDLQCLGAFDDLAGIHEAVESGFWEFEIAPELGPPVFWYPVVYEVGIEEPVDEDASAEGL